MAAEKQKTDRRQSGNSKVPAVHASSQRKATLSSPQHLRPDLANLRILPAFELQPVREPMAIWLAALIAAECHASGNGDRTVHWKCVSGRAVYTNVGNNPERIEPLGVTLHRGQTLAVCWMPGETAFTVEVYRQLDYCA